MASPTKSALASSHVDTAGNQSKKRPATRRKTRDRILEIACVVFNRSGVSGTPMYRIASELEMSPGNLNYHFKSKPDLVLSLAKELHAEIQGSVLQLAPPLDPITVISQLDNVLRALWRYRFVFNSSDHVAQVDNELADQLDQSQDFIVKVLSRYFAATIERGEMRKLDQPDGPTLLSENILAVWLQWLRGRHLDQPEQQEPSVQSLRACMRHHYSLIDPYVSRSFSRVSWKEIDKRYSLAASLNKKPPAKKRCSPIILKKDLTIS